MEQDAEKFVSSIIIAPSPFSQWAISITFVAVMLLALLGLTTMLGWIFA